MNSEKRSDSVTKGKGIPSFLIPIIFILMVAIGTATLLLIGGNTAPGGSGLNGANTGNNKPEVCDHVFGEWEVVSEPTCTKRGEKRRECTICNNEYETEEIKATGHDRVKYDGQEASCYSIGWEPYEVCSVCGASSYEVIYPTHEIESDVCVLCNRRVVMDLEDLLFISRSESNLRKSYVLGQDIDLGGMEWTPIGRNDSVFYGEFDGAGFTISNFKIVSTVYLNNDYCAGFFSYNSGTIKNLYLSDFDISISESREDTIRVGAVASRNSGTIDNCHVSTKSIQVSSKCQYTGGIVGSNNKNAKITNCSVNAVISSSAYVNGGFTYLGGICGLNTGALVSDCISNCKTVNSSTYGYTYVGGLVGKNQNSATVTRSYSDSIVNASVNGRGNTGFAGGLVGYSENSTITACYARGSVRSRVGSSNTSNGSSSTMYTRAGGLVGCMTKGSVTQCYATGDVEAESYNFWGGPVSAGGLIGCAENATVKNSYATGSISVSGMYDYWNYAGGVVAENSSVNRNQLYCLDTQTFTVNNNGPVVDTPTNSYGLKVSAADLLSASYQRDNIGFSEEYWILSDSEHPTLRSYNQ